MYNDIVFFLNGLISRKQITDDQMAELANRVGTSSIVYERMRAARDANFRCTSCQAEFQPLTAANEKSELCVSVACYGLGVHCFASSKCGCKERR